jgi:hypothetical protein
LRKRKGVKTVAPTENYELPFSQFIRHRAICDVLARIYVPEQTPVHRVQRHQMTCIIAREQNLAGGIQQPSVRVAFVPPTDFPGSVIDR